jgi:CubicO group peptidase (beta-lactamase class C family)
VAESLAAELRAIVAQAQAERRAPSVAAAVVRNGEALWTDAVGLADADAGEQATPDHQYRLGSITKSVTAVAVMQLRDAGKLDLDDRLDAHLDVPAHGDLSLRHMLSHASGLQREVPGDVWESLEFPATVQELLAQLEDAERVLAPGQAWHYSNLAFLLLGELVTKVAGMPYDDYVEGRILRPLGMTRTHFAPDAPVAVGYSVDPYSDVLRREPMLVEERGGLAAAGQLWGTVGDLCRFAAFLAAPDPAVLAPATVEEMAAVATMADTVRWSLAWGLGLSLVRRGDRIYRGHDGGMPGYLASVVVDVDGLGAAVLTNGMTVATNELALMLADRVRERLPAAPAPWRPAEAPPPELAGALGRWWSESREFVFRWHDGALEARGAEAPDWVPWARFEPAGDDVLRTVSGRERGEPLRLVRGAGGEVTRMYWATYPFSRELEVTGAR